MTVDGHLVISTLIVSMIKYYVHKTIECAKQNIHKNNIKSYEDVLNSNEIIIDWDKNFKKKDDDFVKKFLQPKFYEHHEIKRMDSRAEFFLNQIFKAFHKHPKQLPEFTYNVFKKEVEHYLEKAKCSEDQAFSQEISEFLEKGYLPCYDSCSYITKSKILNQEQVKNSACPLQKWNRCACEGIRTIINHIAGMTDRYAHLEYSRLYFPPEISRM